MALNIEQKKYSQNCHRLYNTIGMIHTEGWGLTVFLALTYKYAVRIAPTDPPIDNKPWNFIITRSLKNLSHIRSRALKVYTNNLVPKTWRLQVVIFTETPRIKISWDDLGENCGRKNEESYCPHTENKKNHPKTGAFLFLKRLKAMSTHLKDSCSALDMAWNILLTAAAITQWHTILKQPYLLQQTSK